MEIAQFQGTSLIPSRAIRFLTRSDYSHSSFLFDAGACSAASGMVKRGVDLGKIKNIAVGSTVEAWQPTVQNAPSVSALHTKGTKIDIFKFVQPLTVLEEEKLLLTLEPEIGWPYDWKNVIKFVTKRQGSPDGAYFCSELVYAMTRAIGRELLARTNPWECPPDWIHRSPLLTYDRTIRA